MAVHGRRWAWVILAVVVGCSRTPAPPAGTGARESVRDYYDGLVRQDWPKAYAALHPDSQKRFTPEQFSRAGKAYRHDLGFDPEEVKVQSCEENGTEAIARVVLLGRKSSHRRRYRDAVVLRRTAGGWRVVLGNNFGRKPR